MIVKWPEQSNSGAVVDEPVISTDFYPSLLEMAGLPSQWLIKRWMEKALFLRYKANRFKGVLFSGISRNTVITACRVRAVPFVPETISCWNTYENNTVQLFNLRDDHW